MKLAGLSDIQSFEFWGVVAAIITAAISLIQTSFTKRQVDSTVRAWVGAAAPPLFLNMEERRFVFHFTNTGSIPAEDVQLRMIARNISFTKEELKEKGKFDEHSSVKFVVFPGAKPIYHLRFEEPMYEHLKENQFAYIGVRIKYRYGKCRRAEYGTILEYDTRLNTSGTLDEWIE